MRWFAFALVACAACGGTAELGDGGERLGGSGGASARATAGGAPGAEVPGTGGSGTGGACAGELQLLSVEALDADQNGLFEPGQRLTIRALVRNVGAAERRVLLRIAVDDPRIQADLEPAPASVAVGAETMLQVPFTVPEQVWTGSELVFTVLAADPDVAGCTSRSVQQLVVVAEISDELDRCRATRQLELSDVSVADADGDGRVEPGERVEMSVRMTNPGPLDHRWYPGVSFTSDHPGVGFGAYPNPWLYGMFAGSSWTLGTSLQVDPSVAPGTVARITLTTGALQVRCSDLPALEYSLIIQ